MSCCIDAKQGRYVMVTDILEAFLHADTNENFHMIMEGTIAQNGAKLELEIYQKYIQHDEKGRPMLYVQLILVWDKYKQCCYSGNAIRHTCELGAHDQPVQPMHS